MNEQSLPLSVLDTYAPPQPEKADALLKQALAGQRDKIVVIDDDPTGVQTVHGIHVYTDWTDQSILEGFEEENRMFFLLTNSRSMTQKETREVHEQIARGVMKASRATGKPFVIISRSDSTLRGHFPLETETLRREIERAGGQPYDGEILCPFFCEGGRYTLGNVHYVKEGDRLVPAGQTEFARDRSFGYTHSRLDEWCEEKTAGAYPASETTCIPLEMLRRLHASTDGSSVGIAAQDDVFDPLTCVGGVIKLENGALRQSIDIRFPTSTNAETLCAALSKLAQDAGGSFLPDSARVPFYIDPNTPVIQTLIRTYNDVTGKNAQPFTMGGGTYARHFKCAVSFGMEETGEPAPEWVGPMHGPDEGVSEALLFKALKIYILAIARLMQLEF